MKKIVYTVLMCFFAGWVAQSFIPVSAQEDAIWHKIQESGKLIVATSGTMYPSAYHDKETKEMIGYEIDILREAAKRLGLELEFQEMQVDGMLPALESGQVDVIANDFSISKKREEKYLFSSPTKFSFGSIIVRGKDDSGIHTVDDFKGKKAGGGATTLFMQMAQSKGAEPVVYDNIAGEVYMRDVESGRIDFIPHDYYIQTIFLKLFPDFDVKLGKVFYNPSKSAFVYNKEAVTLKEKIDAEIEKLRQEGFVSEASKKYWGDDVSVEKAEIDGMKLSDLPIVGDVE